MNVTHCRINHLREPVIDRQPYVSWVPVSDLRGDRQTAARVAVWAQAESGEPVYDTGWTQGSGCVDVPLFMELAPLTRYVYRVSVRDARGQESSGDLCGFTAGKRGEPFAAKWITGWFCDRRENVREAVCLRRDVPLAQAPARALLVICGLGYFEASINGCKVGDDFLSTPLTAFDQQVQYRVFDVTELLHAGENALGVVLGNGFYNCFTQDPWQTSTAVWRDVPKLLCELHWTDADGCARVVGSGPDWQTGRGPITFNGLRHGERYDARLEQPGWNLPGFADAGWQPAKLTRAPGGTLRVMEMEPIRVRAVRRPVDKWRVRDGWLIDLGVAQAGIAHITFHGQAGDHLTVRYSDLIDETRELDQASLSMFIQNDRFQTDEYTKRSDGPESWHPIFAYHGFQYLEISGNDWEPSLDDIQVWSLCNDFETRGAFTCADERVNRIQQAACNSSTSMCVSVMASDTTREKSSWTGDTGTSCEQMLYNYACEAFLTKWMDDLRDAQRPSGMLPCIIPTPGWGFTFSNGPDWSQPMYEVPRMLWRNGGDLRELRANYGALLRYCAFLSTMAVDGIVNFGLGDWCAPFEGKAVTANMASFKCPVAVSDTAYTYAAVRFAAECAEKLGQARDAQQLSAQAQALKTAFREKLYDPWEHLVQGDCQTATAMMVFHGLAEAEEIPALVAKLMQQIERDGGKLDFGVLGMKAVLNTLGQNGQAPLALDMLTREEYPSLTHWMRQGATTLWECWNGGGSHNHHMFSDVSAFLYRDVAGIHLLPPENGRQRYRLIPMLAGALPAAGATVDGLYGRIACHWQKSAEGFTVTAQVPVSCEAWLHLPSRYHGRAVLGNLREAGQPVTAENGWVCRLQDEGRTLALRLTSGSYDFALR